MSTPQKHLKLIVSTPIFPSKDSLVESFVIYSYLQFGNFLFTSYRLKKLTSYLCG